MWLTRYLSLQDSQSKTIKARQAKLRRQNMVERGDRYFQLVRTITLPKKYAPMLPFEPIIFNLPISITIEDLEDDDDDEVVVSGVIARGEKYLDKKREKVNFILEDLCSEKKLTFIDHPNIEATKHLNRSKLHLNSLGDTVLTNNLLSSLRF